MFEDLLPLYTLYIIYVRSMSPVV